MRKLKLVLPFLLLLLGVLPASAQTAFFNGTAQTINANSNYVQAVPHAIVTVCTYSATPTIPCTGLISLFSDLSNTPLANPITADAEGNFSFAAAPGTYTITITSPFVSGFFESVSVGSGSAALGTVTTTGTPASGQLTEFSGPTAITNGNLSGDVTTLNSLVTSVVSLHFGATALPLGAAPSSNNCLFYNGTNITGFGCGTVSSVALAVPSWLTSSGGPITGSGTLTIAAAGSQISHEVIGTCGAATSFSPCALTTGDLPTGIPNSNLANSSITINNPSFLTGFGTVSLGGTLSPSWLSQTANQILAAPSGVSGAPTFRALVVADIPAINLAGTGNGGVTGNLPVGSIAPGTDGQCINTSASASIWGSCAGTAGEQLLNTDTSHTTITLNDSLKHSIGSFTVPAGQLNALGKSVRFSIWGLEDYIGTTTNLFGFVTIGTQNLQILLADSLGGGVGDIPFSIEVTCTVDTTGVSGQLSCMGTSKFDAIPMQQSFNQSTEVGPVDLTVAQPFGFSLEFGTAASGSTVLRHYFLMEQLN